MRAPLIQFGIDDAPATSGKAESKAAGKLAARKGEPAMKKASAAEADPFASQLLAAFDQRAGAQRLQKTDPHKLPSAKVETSATPGHAVAAAKPETPVAKALAHAQLQVAGPLPQLEKAARPGEARRPGPAHEGVAPPAHEAKKPEARDATPDPTSAVPTPTPHQPSAESASGVSGTGEVSAPPPPAPVLPLLESAAVDESLRIALLPHSARLSWKVEGEGDLSLHLRVREGVADVSVAGAAARLFDARAPEIAAVLAGEGLELGKFDLSQERGGGDHPAQDDRELPHRAAQPNRPAVAKLSTPAQVAPGRIDVKA